MEQQWQEYLHTRAVKGRVLQNTLLISLGGVDPRMLVAEVGQESTAADRLPLSPGICYAGRWKTSKCQVPGTGNSHIRGLLASAPKVANWLPNQAGGGGGLCTARRGRHLADTVQLELESKEATRAHHQEQKGI